MRASPGRASPAATGHGTWGRARQGIDQTYATLQAEKTIAAEEEVISNEAVANGYYTHDKVERRVRQTRRLPG